MKFHVIQKRDVSLAPEGRNFGRKKQIEERPKAPWGRPFFPSIGKRPINLSIVQSSLVKNEHQLASSLQACPARSEGRGVRVKNHFIMKKRCGERLGSGEIHFMVGRVYPLRCSFLNCLRRRAWLRYRTLQIVL